MVDWKQVAHYQRSMRRQSERLEITLKSHLGQELARRRALVNTMSDILMEIAYDEDDPNQEYCNVCHRSLIEEDGHQDGCLYVRALVAITESVGGDLQSTPGRAQLPASLEE